MPFAGQSLDRPTDPIPETKIEVDEANLHTDSSKAERPADQISDGGIVAWLQVAGAFCINLTTW